MRRARLLSTLPSWPSPTEKAFLPLAALPPLPAPRSASLSLSKFPRKRGRPHGAGYLQVKGALSAARPVPEGVLLPPYVLGAQPVGHPEPQLHGAASAARMRAAGALAARVLDAAGALIVPGACADQVDAFVHRAALAAGAYPSPLGYMGFPRSVCVSINEVVCHGIPDRGAVFRPGDVVKVDVSVFLNGVHGDTCRTWVVGGGAGAGDGAAAAALARATRAALRSAIRLCGPGVPVRAIGAHIGALAEAEGFEVVTAFAGHGIGEVFHTQPLVHHGPNSSAYVLREGMAFTIEPMLVEGSADVGLWDDGWAVVTTDGGRAAQFEHTMLVTAHGVDVLTLYEDEP
jgi:methionyl aminopeptidase